jgi:ankyrin repeat protein
MGNSANIRVGPRPRPLSLEPYIRHNRPLSVIMSIVRARPDLILERAPHNGRLPLHRAARHSTSLEMVQFFAEEWREALQEPDHDGCLPLHVAAFHIAALRESSLEIVRYLAREYPPALLLQDKNGRVPLHYAVLSKSLEIVDFLVREEPRALWVKAQGGWLPLHHAAQCGASLEGVRCLVHASSPQCLREATDAIGHRGGSLLPLHVAAEHAPPDIVQFLARAEPRALLMADRIGWLPLHYAAARPSGSSQVQVLQLLAAEYPPALLERTHDGFLPLHVAVSCRSSLEAIQFLAYNEPRALQVRSDPGGYLPLHVAVAATTATPYVDEDVVQYLVRQWPHALDVVDARGSWATPEGCVPSILRPSSRTLPSLRSICC